MLKVKPRDGLKIRDPQRGDLIEPEGRMVPRTTYWLHRLRDRDVVLLADEPDEKKTEVITKARKPRSAEQKQRQPASGDQTGAAGQPQTINVTVSEALDAQDHTA
jgi:hypothetical protein